MSTQTRAYTIRARSPLHVGAGQGVGFIDLPIAREVATKFPFIPGSSVKGVLADKLLADEDSRRDVDTLGKTERQNRYYKRLAFGFMDRNAELNANAGSLAFTDARLICLPIRSFYGTFAWCTCPFVLRRLAGDFERAGIPLLAYNVPLEVPHVAAGTGASLAMHVPASGSALCVPPLQPNQPATAPNVFLEDLDFIATGCRQTQAWAGAIAALAFRAGSDMQSEFAKRLAIIHDDVFGYLCEAASQVDARVAIDDASGTVKSGLWYEESLPEESLLCGLVWCGPVWGKNEDFEQKIGITAPTDLAREVADRFCKGVQELQLGGKHSVGRGQVTLSFYAAPKPPASGSKP